MNAVASRPAFKYQLFFLYFHLFQQKNHHQQHHWENQAYAHTHADIISGILGDTADNSRAYTAPRSPAMARRANMAVPPAGNFLEEILMVPGHMIPTENPQTIQPISPAAGFEDRDARR